MFLHKTLEHILVDEIRNYEVGMRTPSLTTTTSKIPSGLNIGENKRGSTCPGRLNVIENGPGGQSCCTCILYKHPESLGIAISGTTPCMHTLPSLWISHLILSINKDHKKIAFEVTILSYTDSEKYTAFFSCHWSL